MKQRSPVAIWLNTDVMLVIELGFLLGPVMLITSNTALPISRQLIQPLAPFELFCAEESVITLGGQDHLRCLTLLVQRPGSPSPEHVGPCRRESAQWRLLVVSI